MRNLTLVLLFFLLAAPSTADIKSVKIRSDDRGQITFHYFKFTRTGHITIAISSVSVTSIPVTSTLSRPDPSRFGFYILSEEARYRFNDDRNTPCALDSKFISLIFTFQDLHNQSSFNKSYPVTYPNEYTLYFSNCNPLSHVTMDVRTELYNMDNNGTTRNYLSAGITKLPRLYIIFSIIYLCFLCVWISVSFINRKCCKNFHLLMGALLAMKAINLFCAAELQLSVMITGTRSYKWDVLFYISQFFILAVLYTVILIILKCQMILIIVIPLQVLASILSEVAGLAAGMGTDPEVAASWLLMVTIVIIMILGMLVCHVPVTDKADGNYMGEYTELLWVLVWVYLMIINFFFGLLVNNLFYTYHWETNNAEEIMSLVFYMVMFLMFMPFDKYGYFVELDKASSVHNVGFELT